MGKLTLANIRLINLIKTEVDVKRSEKKDFVSKLKDEFSNSSSIIVAEYSGLTVNPEYSATITEAEFEKSSLRFVTKSFFSERFTSTSV